MKLYGSFNWTKVELKRDNARTDIANLYTFNWTKVELKQVFYNNAGNTWSAFNWTKVELKHRKNQPECLR